MKRGKFIDANNTDIAMKLAIFDLDDTLINGDCASLWCRYLMRQGILDTGFLEKEANMMALYAQGGLDMHDYMQFFLEPLRQRTTREVSAWVDDFIRQDIMHRVRSDAVQCINQHQANGDKVLVISASAEFLVRPIAALMGIDQVLAISCQNYKGRYTGQTTGILTFREGKITRLQEWLSLQPETPSDSCFYSDSANDLPLLQWADEAFVVSPEARLAQIAQEKQWPVLNW